MTEPGRDYTVAIKSRKPWLTHQKRAFGKGNTTPNVGLFQSIGLACPLDTSTETVREILMDFGARGHTLTTANLMMVDNCAQESDL